MQHAMLFGDIVEAADRLTVEEQEEILDIISKRILETRRGELLAGVREAEAEFREGRCRVVTPDEIVSEVFSCEP